MQGDGKASSARKREKGRGGAPGPRLFPSASVCIMFERRNHGLEEVSNAWSGHDNACWVLVDVARKRWKGSLSSSLMLGTYRHPCWKSWGLLNSNTVSNFNVEEKELKGRAVTPRWFNTATFQKVLHNTKKHYCPLSRSWREVQRARGEGRRREEA